MMSGVNLRYVASSGRTYNLRSETLRTEAGANFHEWKWDADTVKLRFGERVSAFSRPAAVYEATLTLFGTSREKLAQLEALHDDFELDVRNLTPGRLCWNDYYIECYATESSTKPNENKILVDNTVAFFCPHPFWVKEETRSFLPHSSEPSEQFLDYPYDYDYDYYSGGAGSSIWDTEFPFKTDFRLVIYGPAVDPRILINDHVYQIFDTLGASEHVVIDSKLGTIVKTASNGQKVNAFDLRNKEESVFEQLPPGKLLINWSGTFGFDLTLYEERSEPR